MRKSDVAGGPDEFLELPVGDGKAVDAERIHRDAVDRRLLGIMLVGSHTKGAAGNAHHPDRRGIRVLLRKGGIAIDLKAACHL